MMTHTGLKIFVNGTFDVLHCGHLELLNYAASLGDYLVVALDSDERVKQLKGSTRPVNSITTRKAIMSNLKAVSGTVSFGSDDELREVIKRYSPDIMVVGSDWRDKPIIGSEYAGRLEFYERKNPVSTTSTLKSYIDKLSENNL